MKRERPNYLPRRRKNPIQKQQQMPNHPLKMYQPGAPVSGKCHVMSQRTLTYMRTNIHLCVLFPDTPKKQRIESQECMFSRTYFISSTRSSYSHSAPEDVRKPLFKIFTHPMPQDHSHSKSLHEYQCKSESFRCKYMYTVHISLQMSERTHVPKQYFWISSRLTERINPTWELRIHKRTSMRGLWIDTPRHCKQFVTEFYIQTRPSKSV